MGKDIKIMKLGQHTQINKAVTAIEKTHGISASRGSLGNWP